MGNERNGPIITLVSSSNTQTLLGLLEEMYINAQALCVGLDMSVIEDYKYLAWMCSTDRKIRHKGHCRHHEAYRVMPNSDPE